MTSTADSAVPSAIPTTTTPVQPTDDPLYVSKNKAVGSSIVTQLLNGVENFITWKKSMKIALGVKMKLGFIKVSKEIDASLIHAFDCKE
ncbi:hypothetical protein QQ045_026885 [Rhodiola kirilowii]